MYLAVLRPLNRADCFVPSLPAEPLLTLVRTNQCYLLFEKLVDLESLMFMLVTPLLHAPSSNALAIGNVVDMLFKLIIKVLA